MFECCLLGDSELKQTGVFEPQIEATSQHLRSKEHFIKRALTYACLLVKNQNRRMKNHNRRGATGRPQPQYRFRWRHCFVHEAMSIGWLSSVASASSFHTLIVLSASHVTSRLPLMSKAAA